MIVKCYINLFNKGEITMAKMTKYQLEHFRDKVKRTLDPLIEDQELLVKQYTTNATNKVSKELAVKIGAQKIIDALKFAEEDLKRARTLAQSFFEKKATTKDMKEDLKSKFEKNSSRDYDDDNITAEDCEDQIRTWAKSRAEREIEKRPEGKQLAKLKQNRRSALDTIMESEAPTALIEILNTHMRKFIGISWHERPRAIEQH